MGRKRKNLVDLKFEYRRENPGMFPSICEICVPQRRFKAKPHLGQHNRMKHGLPEITNSHTGVLFDYSAQTVHSNLRNLSTSSSLCTMSASELQTFISNEIEPDTAYNSSCNEVVDQLTTFMQNNFPDELRPSEVIKSGSLGKGTAVKGKSDVDLVVFLCKYDSISSLVQKLPSILEEIKTYLGSYEDCKVTGKTVHAVQVSLCCNANHYHDVDILPSVNILDNHRKRRIYAEMKSSPGYRGYYTAALTRLQRDFVSHVPAKVKTLIRLVKYWKYTDLKTIAKKLPASYVLELITIGKWENAGKPKKFELIKGFFHVISALVEYQNLKLAWNTNYRAADFTSLCEVPYVLDPAHPYNNVMSSCRCWEEIAMRAARFLNKPLFQELSLFSGWQ